MGNHSKRNFSLSRSERAFASCFSKDVCRIWGVKRAGKLDNAAVKSDIPVLFINGEYDNETPPKWAKAMTSNFPNSFHLVFKRWKHTRTTNWSNQCAMESANIFFNDPLVKPKLR